MRPIRVLVVFLLALVLLAAGMRYVFPQAVLSVALDVWLIPRYGIPGAAVASSVTYGTSTALTIWNYRRLSKISFRDLLVPGPADVRLLMVALRSVMRRGESQGQ